MRGAVRGRAGRAHRGLARCVRGLGETGRVRQEPRVHGREICGKACAEAAATPPAGELEQVLLLGLPVPDHDPNLAAGAAAGLALTPTLNLTLTLTLPQVLLRG